MRIVVAQIEPRSGALGGAPDGEPAPLRVGLVRWSQGGPRISVVAKATFSFAQPDPGERVTAVVAAEQQPLSLARPSQQNGAAPGELYYPSDFVPRKAKADVLVVGHAYAMSPAARIDAAIRVGELRRAFTVMAGVPTDRIPLSSGYVRAADGLHRADPVGPAALGEIPRAADLRDDFDFLVYSGAAPSSRAAAIPSNATVELLGLSHSRRSLTVALPGLSPRVFVERGELGPIAVEMTCDTLWITTDHELCVLVWRGSFDAAAPGADEVERLLCALEPDAAPRSFAELRGEVQRAAFALAVEEPDLLPGAEPPPGDAVAIAKYSSWEDGAAEPRITLAQYSQISAELTENREPRGDVLRRSNLDEDRWTVEERAWLSKMSDGAMRGDATLAVAYSELYLAAQDGLTRPAELERTLADYAEIRAAMDEAEDPATVLRARSLSLSEWMRLDRRWSREAASHPGVAADLSRLLTAARSGGAGRG
jgi:Uncharacterized protein conserved in bacteria (DUF2169)